MSSQKKYKLGIALSGGGARGFAHLGVLQALREAGIEADAYAGVSAGAMVGAFVAAGYGPREALDLMKSYKISDYAKVILPINGLLNLSNLEEQLNERISVRRIEELSKPFFIGVTNLLDGCAEYHDQGPLVDFVLASASIPVLFEPVEINGTQYVDGGLMDNIPIRPLRDCCETVIAVNISPIQHVDNVNNLVETAARTFQLTVNNRLEESRKAADIFIEPEGLDQFALLDTSNADELFEIGYRYTNEHLASVKDRLEH